MKAGKPPIVVNSSAGKAKGLNADKLDGHDSTYFSARAYGLVIGTSVSRSKNVVSVTSPFSGVFCITVEPFINPATTGMVVIPDYHYDDTTYATNGATSFVEYDSFAPNCPAGTFQVRTESQTEVTSGSPDGDVRTVNANQVDEPFFFIVP